MDTTALHRLLDEAAAFDPEYGDALSNHLPMAWLALARLGAGEARLREWGASYASRRALRPARKREPWPAGDAWTGCLGRPSAWPIYLDLFEQWLGHEDVGAVLPQVLPALMPGVAAAAFHGLIRTAAGVQAGHAGEVAQGLAHWAAWHQPLGPMPPPASRTVSTDAAPVDPALLLRRLRAGTSRAGLISGRMQAAAADGEVNRVASHLVIDAGTPERLARAAAFAYAESGNFTALHLVTGTHAMRVLSPFIGEGDAGNEFAAVWRCYWQAYAHGVVAAQLRPTAAPLTPVEWPQLIDTARSASDEHLIKLVDACREEERRYGGDDWRHAASRAAMLMK